MGSIEAHHLLPTNMMNFILAIVPILLILALMVGFRWGASRAGAAGYLCALVIALTFFGAGPVLLAYAHTKALLLSLDVLLIVWAAFLIYKVSDEAGTIQTIGSSLPHLTGDRGMLAVIIGWIFASFLQGVGGFGVPVAVVAPLMVGLGFSPLAAVVIPSIGHSWAVTFGSLGSSFQALMAATGLPGETLAAPSATLLGIGGLVVGYMVVHATEGWRAVRRLWLPVLIIGLAMGVGQYFLAVLGLWNIAAFGGSLVGLGVAIPLASRYQGESKIEGEVQPRALAVAVSAYVILIAIILTVQFIPSLKSFLGGVSLQLEFPQVRTALGFTVPAESGRKITWFSHAGTLLLYASVLGFFIYKKAGLYTPGVTRRIIVDTIRKMIGSSLGIVSMVTMAVVMTHAGMTDTIARGLADGMGRAFPMGSPWIGALGAFMTGSNTNSNVVLSALQMRTAEILGYSIPLILAAQTAGGAFGSVIAPTKIVVGASTAGLTGQEGEVIAKLAVYTLGVLLIVALIVFAITI